MKENMKQDRSGNGTPRLSWKDWLSQSLLGKLKTRERLVRVLREAQRHGLFDADAQGMIEGALQVVEMQVRDIMIPRSQMVVVSRDDSPDELIPVAIQSGHSRFPVVGDSRYEVIGLLPAMDLSRHSPKNEKEKFSVREILRAAASVPENCPTPISPRAILPV